MTQEEALRQAYEDLLWAESNDELEEKYSGELVLIHQHKVLAHGTDRGVLLEEAARRGLSREEVVILAMLPANFEVPPDLTL